MQSNIISNHFNIFSTYDKMKCVISVHYQFDNRFIFHAKKSINHLKKRINDDVMLINGPKFCHIFSSNQ